MEALLIASIHYVGAFQTDAGVTHYWSYPTTEDLAWVELTTQSMGLAVTVSDAVRSATANRSEHKVRKVDERRTVVPLALRPKPPKTVWAPANGVFVSYWQHAWVEQTSFDNAVKIYRARAGTHRAAGVRTRYFCLQLTSGRYACVECREDFPQTISISLEVDERGAGKKSGGTMSVRDIEEVLRPLGGKFKMPSANLWVGWRNDV